MNCIEARRMVTPFVKRELSDRETEQFLKHVEHCSDCMDELNIYFTVYKALNMLDSEQHHEYDFEKMLGEEIHAARLSILRHRVSGVLHGLLFAVAELLLIGSVFTGFEMRQGDRESMIRRAIQRLGGKQSERMMTPDDMTEEAVPGVKPSRPEKVNGSHLLMEENVWEKENDVQMEEDTEAASLKKTRTDRVQQTESAADVPQGEAAEEE